MKKRPIVNIKLLEYPRQFQVVCGVHLTRGFFAPEYADETDGNALTAEALS